MSRLKLCLFFCFSLPLLAQGDNSTKITLSGTLIEPPACTINEGSPIPINFGNNIGTSRIDGENYKRTVDYKITCDDDPNNAPWVLNLTVTGTPTTFDPAAVQMQIDDSDSKDLGVKLILNGEDFKLNTPVEIKQLSEQPELEAVPVKDGDATLPEGYFHATATLLAGYE